MNNIMPTRAHKTIDWEAIEDAYCAGIIPLRKIAEMHGLALSALQKRAKRDNWIRDITDKVDKRVRAIVSRTMALNPTGGQTGGQKCKTGGQIAVKTINELVKHNRKDREEQIVTATANIIAAVQIAHRGEIAALRDKAGELRRRLDEESATLKEDVQVFGALTNAYGQVIRLEREVYGIDKNSAPTDEKDRNIKVEIVSRDTAVRVETV
jgi:hypothetical protein